MKKINLDLDHPYEETKKDTKKNNTNSSYILTFDPAVNRETGASGRRYQDITLTVDGLNSVQMRRSQEKMCPSIIDDVELLLIYIYIYIYILKLVDHNWGRPDGSLFNSYYTEV